MPRGFGRGARVTVVTKAQASGRQGKKTPRGLRGGKKIKMENRRRRRDKDDKESDSTTTTRRPTSTAQYGRRGAGEDDDDDDMERRKMVGGGPTMARRSMKGVEGDASLVGGRSGTLAHQIASVNFPTLVCGRGQKLKHLRKQLMQSVKQIRKRHEAKNIAKKEKEQSHMAAVYARERLKQQQIQHRKKKK